MAAGSGRYIIIGVLAFIVIGLGFTAACAGFILFRLHRESTRWAAFVEDTPPPVSTQILPACPIIHLQLGSFCKYSRACGCQLQCITHHAYHIDVRSSLH